MSGRCSSVVSEKQSRAVSRNRSCRASLRSACAGCANEVLDAACAAGRPAFCDRISYDEGLAERLRRSLGQLSNLSESRMFGGICSLLLGKMMCGVHRDTWMFRVGKPQHSEAGLSDRVRSDEPVRTDQAARVLRSRYRRGSRTRDARFTRPGSDPASPASGPSCSGSCDECRHGPSEPS